MRGIWLHTVKKWVTGTLVGSSYALDVAVKSLGLLTYKEHRFHDASSTTINASGGAYIQLETAADIANTITGMLVSNNTGASLVIGVGANSGAVTVISAISQGQSADLMLGVSLSSGNKVWVRALQNSAISSGELLVSFWG